MTRILTVLVACALASAAVAEGGALYLGGGLGLPMSPDLFKDAWSMGLGGYAGYGAQASPGVEVIGRIGYSRFSFDEEGLLESVGLVLPPGATLEVDGGTLTALEIAVDVKLLFQPGSAASTRPYFVGSVGYSKSEIEAATVVASYAGDSETVTVPSSDDSGLCYGGGLGLEFDIGEGKALLVEGRYQILTVEGDDLNYLPVRVLFRLAM